MPYGTWISVEERLPEIKPMYVGGPNESGTVLTFNGSRVDIGRMSETSKKREMHWRDRFGRREYVTHWMPLPDAPKGAK